MAFEFVTGTGAANGGNPDLVVTTGANFAGSDFFVACVASTSDIGTPVVTDSLGNVWAVAHVQTGDVLISTHYAKNANSADGQTFQAALTGGNMAIFVFGFSGSNLTNPKGSEDFLNTNGTDNAFDYSVPIVPSQRNTLGIIAVGIEGSQTLATVGNGFIGPSNIPYVVGESYGLAVAWKKMHIPEILNPYNTFTGSVNFSALLEIFLSAEGGSPNDIILMGDGLT